MPKHIPCSVNRPVAAVSLMLLTLSGCGGGGGGSSSSTQNPVPINNSTVTRITASQAGAAQLVQIANDYVDDVAQASQVGTLGGAAPASASNTNTVDCAQTFGNGTGSGTMTVDSAMSDDLNVYDTSTAYNHCSYSDGLSTVTLNGSITQHLVFSGDDYSLQANFDLNYAVTGNASYTYRYQGNKTCTQTAGDLQCTFNEGSTGVSGLHNVAVTGSHTSIGSGTIQTRRDDLANSLTVVYTNWSYDSSSGVAQGSTVIDDSQGTHATIDATVNSNRSTYTVRIVRNGATSTYTIQP